MCRPTQLAPLSEIQNGGGVVQEFGRNSRSIKHPWHCWGLQLALVIDCVIAR